MTKTRSSFSRLMVEATVLVAMAAPCFSDDSTGFQEFARQTDVEKKLQLLDQIVKGCRDEELPEEARYLLALKLLVPHLSWHAAYEPPPSPRVRIERIRKIHRTSSVYGWRWAEANAGESWMHKSIPDDVKKRLKEAKASIDRGADDGDLQKVEYFWRLKDTRHQDVARATRLLKSVKVKSLARSASRWIADIERNNIVVTLDVLADYSTDRVRNPVLVDVRNAEMISLSIYRVRSGEDLLGVTARIGHDFVYCDHGLQWKLLFELDRVLREKARMSRPATQTAREEFWKFPKLDELDLIKKWDLDVAKLDVFEVDRDDNQWTNLNADGHADGDFFGDNCDQFYDRILKRYWPGHGRLSSWRCDRIVDIPHQAIAEPGAYVLAVTANGVTAYAPIVVRPLSLTMRRCRDGIMILASDNGCYNPVSNASVHANGSQESSKTDKNGVAFLNAFAGGDRAVVVQHEGRFAIGGFGRVFDGIYESERERKRREERIVMHDELRRMQHSRALDLFEDRHLVGVLTDRSEVRARQLVRFKLLVRELERKPRSPIDTKSTFRTQEFEVTKSLRIPEIDTRLSVELLDGDRRVVARSNHSTNRFGSCAGQIALPKSAKSGLYSFRITIDEMDRVVPGVFRVGGENRADAGNDARQTLEGVARFTSHNSEMSLNLQSKDVKVEFVGVEGSTRTVFPVENGKARIEFREVGWHRITSGKCASYVYVYGGKERGPPPPVGEGHFSFPGKTHRWVNLSDDSSEQNQRRNHYTARPHLFALFDQREVEVGGKLKLLVYAPVERARLLFTLEGRTIVDYFVTSVSGMATYYHEIEIPISERSRPNFYLQGRILTPPTHEFERVRERERELLTAMRIDPSTDLRSCRIDVRASKCEAHPERLKVAIEVEKKQSGQGDRIPVTIRVTNLDGKPCEAEVLLSIVDPNTATHNLLDSYRELMRQFSDPHTPRRFMQKKWRVQVERQATVARESTHHVAEELEKLEERVDGIARREVAETRENKTEDSSMWQPMLGTDENGILSTTINVPSARSELSLRVIALTTDNEYGSAVVPIVLDQTGKSLPNR